MAIQEGKAAPAFELTDQDGDQVALKDYKGRDVILYFYPRDNTSGCTKEACAFRDLWGEIESAGAVVLGVSPDGARITVAVIQEARNLMLAEQIAALQ